MKHIIEAKHLNKNKETETFELTIFDDIKMTAERVFLDLIKTKHLNTKKT